MLSLVSVALTIPIMLVVIFFLVVVCDLEDVIYAALFGALGKKADFLERFNSKGIRELTTLPDSTSTTKGGLRQLTEEEMDYCSGYAATLDAQRGPSARMDDVKDLPYGEATWVVAVVDVGCGEPTKWGMMAEPRSDPPMKLLMVCDEATGNPLLRRFVSVMCGSSPEEPCGEARPDLCTVLDALFDVALRTQQRPAEVALAQPSIVYNDPEVREQDQEEEIYFHAVTEWLAPLRDDILNDCVPDRLVVRPQGTLEEFCGIVSEHIWQEQLQRKEEAGGVGVAGGKVAAAVACGKVESSSDDDSDSDDEPIVERLKRRKKKDE